MEIEDFTRNFESLGDNCELGFIQRFEKNEEGGLLRWSVSPPASLIQGITYDFADLYLEKNLTPHTDGMVLDSKYGFYFHTAMRSEKKVFVHEGEDRSEIYRKEYDKVQYLVEKLNGLLASGERTFVYKHNEHISDAVLKELSEAIASKGPGKLLYVSDQLDSETGSVKHLSGNIFVGKIDKFASYSEANQPSINGWHLILKNYLELQTSFA